MGPRRGPLRPLGPAAVASLAAVSAALPGPPAGTPNVFGGAGHGLDTGYGDGCSGQLFAFSGLDGPTRSTSNFVAVFQNASNYDMRFCLSASRYVRLRPPGQGEVLASTGDVLWARHAAGDVKLGWQSWDLLAGVAPSGSFVSVDGAFPLPMPYGAPACMVSKLPGVAHLGAATPEAAENASAIVLCQTTASNATPDNRTMGVALAYGDTYQQALEVAEAAAKGAAASIDSTIAARLSWVPGTPRVSSARRQMLLNKAVSVMRVNSLGPEGDIVQHWSTPDRVPHRFMWLWDSCYHSMARSVLNDTLGWEFLESMLSVQLPSGAIPIERSPLGPVLESEAGAAQEQSDFHASADFLQTQPPLLAWAVWENAKLARRGRGAEAEAAVRERLAYAVPRLERYLQWDFDNRGDPTGETPLLYWFKGTESGMDNSPRFDGYNRSRPLLAVDFSVFAAREAAYLSHMHLSLGNASASMHWSAVAARLRAAVHETLWDEARGFYYDRHLAKDGGEFSDVPAVSGLLPLWLPDLPEDRAAKLLATLSDTAMFEAPVPLPSVAASAREFSTDLWRGPAWLNTNWHVALALLSRNETAAAQRLMSATVDAVDSWYHAYGVVFEFYDAKNATDPTVLPRKGKLSGGVRDFHWTAAITFRMILELEDLEKTQAPRSPSLMYA